MKNGMFTDFKRKQNIFTENMPGRDHLNQRIKGNIIRGGTN